MDLAVTDVMQQHRGPALAAAQLRDKVVAALRNIRRDRPFTQGADGVGADGVGADEV